MGEARGELASGSRAPPGRHPGALTALPRNLDASTGRAVSSRLGAGSVIEWVPTVAPLPFRSRLDGRERLFFSRLFGLAFWGGRLWGSRERCARANPRDNPESDAVGFAPFSDEGAGSVAEVTQLVRWGGLSWKPDWLGGGGTWEKKSLEPRPASPAPPRAGRRPRRRSRRRRSLAQRETRHGLSPDAPRDTAQPGRWQPCGPSTPRRSPGHRQAHAGDRHAQPCSVAAGRPRPIGHRRPPRSSLRRGAEPTDAVPAAIGEQSEVLPPRRLLNLKDMGRGSRRRETQSESTWKTEREMPQPPPVLPPESFPFRTPQR